MPDKKKPTPKLTAVEKGVNKVRDAVDSFRNYKSHGTTLHSLPDAGKKRALPKERRGPDNRYSSYTPTTEFYKEGTVLNNTYKANQKRKK